jgi:class 3 adenylate cyclase/predicted ATPase
MDVAAWLHDLGLPQYRDAFEKNAIDAEVLRELTAGDLKEMGIAAVGHRRKLLAAIAALRTAASLAAETPSAPAPEKAATAAERRLLTVMFCDLVGSTPLSARLDPEDLRDVLGAYHAAVAQEIARFGGYVAKYMGDGVLAYFGYPQAHEEDAERALRAGLALAERIARLDTGGERLAARIGIATGLVVVGDLLGHGEAQERGVVGETPNLAARLQAMAEPGIVLIDERTRRLVGQLFEYRDLGATGLRGIAGPVPVFAVLRPSAVASRFEALRAAALTPLVGREEEIALLLRRWRRAAQGEGQVVLICGEPGIGKSRLTAALRDRLADEDYMWLRYFTSPHHQDSALYPFIAQLERAAYFEREDPPDSKLDKLAALLAPASAEEMALFAELLSVPAAPRYPPPALSAQRKKERTFEALLRQFEALARHKPVLMVFEDLHWIDPSSRELLDRTIERIASLPVLLVATFRPEFAPPWSGLPQATVLTLARLDRRAGAEMVQGIAGNAALSSEAAAEIVERADGIPLFVEELTRAVIEAGGCGEGAEKALAGALSPSAAVPAALHAPLMARLDRLGPRSKEIAQIAAVIGREFSYELLAPVADHDEAELADALGRLGEAGLVFSRGTLPHATYLFKHALVRDTAYGSLLRRRREELHARIATALETDFPETAAAQPEIVAHHYTEAGRAEQAVPYWHRAGERAIERSANLEAIAHLTRGIEVLKTLPQNPERDEQELVLQVALTNPLWASRGFGSPAAERVATRVLELNRQIGADTPAHFWAVFGVALFYEVRGVLPPARELREQSLRVAERLQDPELLAYGHFGLGHTMFWFGALALARAHLEQAVALYDPEWGRTASFLCGFNCASSAHMFLGRALWHLGYPDQALHSSNRAVAIAKEVSHPFSLAAALSWAAALHQVRREADQTREVAEAALALTAEQLIPFFAAHAMVLRGWALVEQGQYEEGVTCLREGIDAYRATGANHESSHWFALLADACGKAGQIEGASSVVRDTLAEVERTGIRYHEAELHRLDGELRLGFDEAGAEACFQRAIAIARAQQAKSLELRAALSLARLWQRQGKRDEARDLLAPVYGWFTEGFDTADLREAAALLDRLR